MAFGQTPGSGGDSGLKKIFVSGLTETSLIDLEGIGTIRFEGSKVYKWVKYNDGSANLDIVSGDSLVYVAESGYAAAVVTADVSDGDTLPIGAGLAVGTVTVDATYMWIQIKGLATLSLDATGSSPGDGDAICAPTNGGTDKVVIVDPPDNRIRMGVSIDDTAKTVILDCPF